MPDAVHAGPGVLPVLPRVCRRPARLLMRMIRGEVVIPRNTGLAAASAFFLATGAYGMVLGGHTSTVMEAMTSASGMAIDEVRITGSINTTDYDVAGAIGLGKTMSLATFDADAARERVVELPWVEAATVRKVYPDAVQVDLTERMAHAVWQHGDRLTVIDGEGQPIEEFVAARDRDLPLITGRGAAERVREAVGLVAAFPSIANQVKGFIRVGERRWDIRLKSGVTLKLPEKGAGEALETVVAMDGAQALLRRDLSEIDLRLADRVTLRLSEDATKQREEAIKARQKAYDKAMREART